MDQPLTDRLDSLTGSIDSAAKELARLGMGAVPYAATLTDGEIDQLYLGNVYAGRIVDALPDDCTRKGWRIEVKDERIKESDPFKDPMDTLAVADRFNRADKLGRKDGGAAIFISVDDGQTMDQPVALDRIRRIKTLQVIERHWLQPVSWESDINSPNFNEPNLYRFTPFTRGSDTTEGAQRPQPFVIHADRLLLFAGTKIPQRLRMSNGHGWHDSVLRRPWYYCIGLAEVDRSIRSILNSFSQAYFESEGLADMAASNPEALAKRLMLLRLGMSAYGIASVDKDRETLGFLQRGVAGLSDLYDRAAQSLASAAEMPVTKLFGQAPGGLATDDASGTRNWNENVADRQGNEYKPLLERLVTYFAAAKDGPTRGIIPEEFDIHFNSLDVPTAKEEIESKAAVAQMDKAYFEMGVYSPDAIAKVRSEPNGHMLPIPYEAELEPYEPTPEQTSEAETPQG